MAQYKYILEVKTRMNIFINHRDYQVENNETVLQAALRNKLTSIPSLCYHPALRAEASCRLCVVEVKGEAGLYTACTLKVREGLSVLTKTAAVVASRRRTLRYLLNRNPHHKLLQKWGEEYGADGLGGAQTLPPEAQTLPNCLLCGLCVRACRQLGCEALQFIGRGVDRHVQRLPAFRKTACIGCHACERLCPAQAIHSEITDSNLKWEHWEEEHHMATCTMCHKMLATQAALDYVKNKVPASRLRIQLCSECKRILSQSPLSRSKGEKTQAPGSMLKSK